MVAVVSGMSVETCNISLFRSLGTLSLVLMVSVYTVLGIHRRALLLQAMLL